MFFVSRGLKALGHSVEVFSFRNDHPMHREFSDLGVPVYTANHSRLIFEDRLKLLYEPLRCFQPTVVFAVIGADALEMLRYVPRGVLRVAMLHDKTIEAFQAVKLHRHCLDHLVVVSPPLLQCVPEWVSDLPCTYLEHGVPFRENMPVRQPNPDGPLKILYYGRIDQDPKQVRLFPVIWRGLKERQVSFRWTIHGRGKDEGYLREQMAEGVAAGEIFFSKPVHHAELDAIIGRHDVYLLASRLEGGPLTLLESMARGLVPVCGDIPCLIQRVVSETNGFRVPCSSADAYVKCLAKLDGDRALLESMSADARRTIRDHFSEMAMAQRYVDFVQTYATAAGLASWATAVEVQPLLGAPSPVLRAPALRPFRRWLKRLHGAGRFGAGL
jgi:glycosyltransferase involved in cell wall biosynthesis